MDWVGFVYRPLTRHAARRALVGRIRSRQVPEQGRFTRTDVDQLLALAWTSYRKHEAAVPRQPTMGSRWFTGGVVAAPRGRIQFDFRLDGTRYRPSINRPPSEANLRRARERLEVINDKLRMARFPSRMNSQTTGSCGA